MARIDEELVRGIADAVRKRVGERIGTTFESCFRNTLSTTMRELPDGTLFLLTGDIPAMWLRDSTAQLTPYLHFADRDPLLADTISRVSRRQLDYVLLDPYANAFNAGPDAAGHQSDATEQSPWVWERKYEVDSLCYPVQLAHDLWRITGRTDHLDRFAEAARAIIALWRVEQRHETDSDYRFQRFDAPQSDTLVRDGLGPLTEPTGLTWSGFRPSDDATEHGYNIPGNAFAAVELAHIAELAREVLDDAALADDAEALRAEIAAAIAEHGVVAGPDGDPIYAYEVDGRGATLVMDDANVPSLLSLPMLGWCASDDPLYLATRRAILGPHNPHWARGEHAYGIGSPHTPPGHVWPIALAVEGLTATEESERMRIIETLVATDAGTGLMHESFHPDDPTVYTRPWFSWANAMFCELVLDACGLRTHRRAPIGSEVTG
ncbi:hypothetical protein CLV46_3230 [Diaminobutyricimonas aerilata]|uniref:Metal-independent alpha-mannosidase n=1 Tax=Diaminobutyricimonas aerilata TaxID=1162967 RepID=A0A2M9CP07_9MICO|nr:glycoside hydrolase family 125 protein [Diaminobutyricimonas aerilata]PJJ73636.1 hypothetical protein CLV46_3230 [Diaminobutyricimonas aerilata]